MVAISEPDYSVVTELAGAPISGEQLLRLRHRYAWASGFCRSMDVVECACGTGPGLGLLSRVSATLVAGDLDSRMVAAARKHYQERVEVIVFDAQQLPFEDRSKDRIILCEALYYLPDAERFVRECARVLRPEGMVLVVTANKDLWDFHPSIYAHRYYGAMELRKLFESTGFSCALAGFQDVARSSIRERILRPVKRVAVALKIMPTTMAGKRWLKSVVFGKEVEMPAELAADGGRHSPPDAIDGARPDRRHKILYCAARLMPRRAESTHSQESSRQ
jgi:ubiquinone/menaquinone biosynthesis C-methylase UbiE